MWAVATGVIETATLHAGGAEDSMWTITGRMFIAATSAAFRREDAMRALTSGVIETAAFCAGSAEEPMRAVAGRVFLAAAAAASH